MSINKVMEVKEAIKFLRSHFKIGIYTKKSEEIIALLKQLEKYKKREIISELFVDEQGEKYRQMIDKIRDHYRYNSFIIHSGRAILEYLEKLEEAYFPKEASQNYKEGEE